MRPGLPTGTVTFLFTDIEGSTRLLQQLGDAYAGVLSEHHALLREVWARHRGVEVDTAGDSFFVAFSRASDAVAAAGEAQLALAAGPARVRIGLHTGEPIEGAGGYVGLDVHRAARIAAAGHGGQVLLSQATTDLAGIDAHDLGLHRLKDLSAPERLFQLGTERFPPLKTLHETNLPVPATPFLGRDRELAEIAALLLRPETRLVTLTGPGGSGKTRLALQGAGAAADGYEHGVWWVPLAPLTDHALVETAAAQALGAKTTLAAAVGDQRLLLLLDNFEHLLDAAPVVADTISASPNLTVLVTSREPLHLDGEWEVPVDPLQEPEAVELFVQRAAAVHSDAAPNGEVAEICRRLDCLPLAVELAAARAKALSLQTLLARLDQRLPLLAGGSRSAPERQRTLRATIAWSHDLLSEPEQELFARLAVFGGGCTLEAAEEICGANIDAVASLVDKSLLRRTGDRYWMLETIREFAAERLEALAEAAALRDKHAAWCIALGEQAQPELRARHSREWLDRLADEHANLRAALDHLLERGNAEGAFRLCGSIWLYWQTRGHWTEGRRYIDRVISRGENVEPEVQVDAVWGGAILAIWQGDLEDGEAKAARLWELSATREDRAWRAAHHIDGVTASVRGDRQRATALLEEGLVLARSGGDEWLLSIALNNLGSLYLSGGEYERAIVYFEEALAVGEARGDLDRRARQLVNLGFAAHGLRDLERSRELFSRGLATSQEVGLVEAEINALLGLAACEAEDGDPIWAARMLGCAQASAARVGHKAAANYLLGTLGLAGRTERTLSETLGSERLDAELGAGAALSRDEVIGRALSAELG